VPASRIKTISYGKERPDKSVFVQRQVISWLQNDPGFAVCMILTRRPQAMDDRGDFGPAYPYVFQHMIFHRQKCPAGNAAGPVHPEAAIGRQYFSSEDRIASRGRKCKRKNGHCSAPWVD
jgi:hypothetical protein